MPTASIYSSGMWSPRWAKDSMRPLYSLSFPWYWLCFIPSCFLHTDKNQLAENITPYSSNMVEYYLSKIPMMVDYLLFQSWLFSSVTLGQRCTSRKLIGPRSPGSAWLGSWHFHRLASSMSVVRYPHLDYCFRWLWCPLISRLMQAPVSACQLISWWSCQTPNEGGIYRATAIYFLFFQGFYILVWLHLSSRSRVRMLNAWKTEKQHTICFGPVWFMVFPSYLWWLGGIYWLIFYL